jgi:hypothetical protein
LVLGGIVALSLMVALLFLLFGNGGGDDTGAVLGVTVTPTASSHASVTPTVAPTATATATAVPETDVPTDVPTEEPTDEPTAEPEPTNEPVGGNGAPLVAITAPPDGTVYCPAVGSDGQYTQEIPLEANVSDAEDGFLPNESVSWSYSVDGSAPEFFANSVSVSLELHVAPEQSRQVTVTIDATDSDENVTSTSLALVVGGPDSGVC